ncbi:MAG: tRNA (cytidine(56)-2'-O)-methyltransferase [Methanolinea sp.]|nr:tRNA (cytidine(56)-2'-O)-methyltransferase [Methanolinea sp.]
MTEVYILRLGHRPERDQRVTTHVGLTARALGARGMYLASSDRGIVESIEDVVSRWGGDFSIRDKVSWRRLIREWKESGGTVVHLTMYGEPLPVHEETLRQVSRILVVVGAEKVPGEIYTLADYNISVTNQPHSEVAGLAVFLDHLFGGKELTNEFPGWQIRVIPSPRGKKCEEV